jgi:hypothetical protein
MKKIIYALLSFVTISIALVSCDDHNPNEDKFGADNKAGWVELTTNDTVRGFFRGTQFLIPVVLDSPINTDGVDVAYTIEDITGTTDGFISQTGIAHIPANTTTGNIVLNFNDVALPGALEFKITLTGTNKSNITIGLDGDSRIVSQTVRVCPVNYSTSYAGSSELSDRSGAGPDFNVALVPVEGTNNQFTLSTVWGDNFVATLTNDPRDNGQFLYPVTLTVKPDGNVVIDTDVNYGNGGVGTYDACSNTFRLNVDQSIFDNPFSVDVVLAGN